MPLQSFRQLVWRYLLCPDVPDPADCASDDRSLGSFDDTVVGATRQQ